MSLMSPLRRVRVSVLDNTDQHALLDLLNARAADTVYLRSLIHAHGTAPTAYPEHGRFLGGWKGDALVSLVFLGNSRNFTTLGSIRDLGPVLDRAREQPSRPRLFVGPAEHAVLARRFLGAAGGLPTLDRAQAYYELLPEALNPLPPCGIEPAREPDLEAVARAQAEMTAEDLLISRDQIDLDRLRVMSRDRIARGTVWMVRRDGGLVFKTEETSRAPDGVLVGGVFTHPRYRGQGLAAAGIAEWAGILFTKGLRRMVLHVNTANLPAVRAYERVGFVRRSTLRLILSY
jgi:RimJ/RimL family protein N-acetyltransferase